MRGERDAYLAPLAAWCHVPPREVNSLAVTDFILLVTWIDRKRAVRKEGGDL